MSGVLKSNQVGLKLNCLGPVGYGKMLYNPDSFKRLWIKLANYVKS